MELFEGGAEDDGHPDDAYGESGPVVGFEFFAEEGVCEDGDPEGAGVEEECCGGEVDTPEGLKERDEGDGAGEHSEEHGFLVDDAKGLSEKPMKGENNEEPNEGASENGGHARCLRTESAYGGGHEGEGQGGRAGEESSLEGEVGIQGTDF